MRGVCDAELSSLQEIRGQESLKFVRSDLTDDPCGLPLTNSEGLRNKSHHCSNLGTARGTHTARCQEEQAETGNSDTDL